VYIYINKKHEPPKQKAMKKIKFFTVLSLALIIFSGFGTASAQRISRNDIQAVKKTSLIEYVVRVESSNYLVQTGHYLVLMTDETGREIGPSQMLRTGVSDYYYYEPGPVTGTRIARLIKLPLGPHSNDIPPCIRTGTFLGDTGYLFIIRPITTEKIGWNDKN
jgi:hypothetical protein